MIPLLRLTPYPGDGSAPSPNFGTRQALAIQGIVLHATADGGNETGALAWLCSPESRVSCHLLVGRSGYVTRLVGDQQRAWHAGLSRWRRTRDVNSITLGIEIANRNDGEPYTDAQYHRTAEIVAHYCRQGLTMGDVVGHGEITDERRTDPAGWNWDRFRRLVREQLHLAGVEAARAASSSASISPAPPVAAPATPRVSTITKAPPRRASVISAKPALHSRTIWLNGLTALATGSLILGDALQLDFWIRLTLPETITTWVLFGVAILNFLLRFETSCPIIGSAIAERSTPGLTLRVR